MKPLPLHVQEHEAAAMFAGVMTQKRVPLSNRWTPRGKSQSIVTPRLFAHADAGALFWIGEPFTWWQGRGRWEAMEHIDYTRTPLKFAPKPPQVSRWKMHPGTAEQMHRNLSRMTVEVISTAHKPVVEISDYDVVAEGMGFLTAPNLRAAFLRRYRETYGDEFGSWTADCMVVRFKVTPQNIGSLLRDREAA